MDIPAGYMLQVRTWENDGDNYNTNTLYGLNEAEVRFYLDLCDYFNDKGNDYLKVNEVLKFCEERFHLHKFFFSRKYLETWQLVFKEWSLDDELREFLGNPSEHYWSGNENEDFFRTVEDVKVYYVPEDLKELSETKFKS